MTTGGEVIVGTLEALGVRHVYGIVSVHNLPIYEAFRSSTITPVAVRHEQAAMAAADGAARVSGSLAVAITSTGPGAANAMAATLEANTSGSPVLHITGQIDSHHLGHGRGFIHECPDQLSMLRACNKYAVRADDPATLASTIAKAAAEALRAPTGPSAVEVPIDIQYGAAETDQVEVPVSVQDVDADALDALAELVSSWRRPLIWAGGGSVGGDAPRLVRQLAERLGAGVLTSPNGRGVLPEDHPLVIGNVSLEPAARELVARADGMLLIGTRLQGPNTSNWTMPLPSQLAQIDIDPRRIGQNYSVACSVVGDAGAVLRELLGRVDADAADSQWPAQVAHATDASRGAIYSTLGAQAPLFDELHSRLPGDTIVVKDATIPAYTWGNRLLTVRRPRMSIMPNSFAIGLGMGQAIGAAHATGQRTLCIVGDGGFMLAATELATAAQLALPVTVLVFNDGGYGILRNIQAAQFGAAGSIGSDLHAPSFVALAESMGVNARAADSVADYAKAIDWALESPGPNLVEINLSRIGPMSTPYIGTARPPTRS